LGDKFTLNVSLHDAKGFVAPLALQMLIENAVKHNEISQENPLHINVYQQNDCVVVENNLQKRLTSGEVSSGIGLENIVKRYQFLSNEPVVIEETKTHFVVKLPLIPSS